MESEVLMVKQFLDWYDNVVRSFLGKLSPEKVAEFDKDRNHLLKAVEVTDTEVAICFLGASGIGKSTLINAMVGGSQSVVPAGGVGPLTAQALAVRNRPTRGLEVEYHGSDRINNTIFGLEQMFRAELGAVETSKHPRNPGESEEDELPEDAASTQADSSSDSDTDSDGRKKERREQFKRSARLLVKGGQDIDSDLRYLLDSLKEVIGGKRVWGTTADPADQQRLQGISRALSLAKEGGRFILDGSVSEEEFRRSLREHATGYLAPLIKNLSLDWPGANLASDITLVDLPGVGIVHDAHAEVTRKWIREKAQAIVLVVDHRGMTEPLADALRNAEFLNSLLYSADEPEDDPIVIVAITRIDDIADTRRHQDKSKRKFEHFLDLIEEAKGRLKDELQRQLEEIWLKEESASEGRRQVVRNLLDTLQVHPLSAPEYTKLIAEDEDNPSFLRGIEQTGIPNFIAKLEKLAADRRAKAMTRLQTRASVFREQVETTLQLIEAQWEGEGRAEEEAARLREELDVFIQPLRLELANRQGGYRAFLKKNIPQRIADLVQAAKMKASKDIDRYLARLGQAHWGTLRASVRRGGRYSGASDINLPTAFALRFEEPIAEVWGKEILKDIRKETKDYAADCVSLVEQVAQWALNQGARVQSKIVEAQRDAILADARKLQSVGQEMVKEMRDEAKAHLINAIEGPIKTECDSFVRKNMHVGSGVKQRILDLYAKLADTVTEAAEEPAKKILLKLFKDVEKEILAAFADRQDPLDSIFNAIVISQQKYLERSDAQKRRRILNELKIVMGSRPALDSNELDAQRMSDHAI